MLWPWSLCLPADGTPAQGRILFPALMWRRALEITRPTIGEYWKRLPYTVDDPVPSYVRTECKCRSAIQPEGIREYLTVYDIIGSAFQEKLKLWIQHIICWYHSCHRKLYNHYRIWKSRNRFIPGYAASPKPRHNHFSRAIIPPKNWARC